MLQRSYIVVWVVLDFWDLFDPIGDWVYWSKEGKQKTKVLD
jgi:hypothetical protein